MKFHAKYVSVGESGDEYFQVSFDNEAPSDDDFDLSGPDHPYLIVQRQFEDDDGGVCYIETHDHDTYTGHFRLRLIEFTPTRLAFEIARADHKYVEVTYDLDAKRFGDVQRIVRIVFGVQELRGAATDQGPVPLGRLRASGSCCGCLGNRMHPGCR